MIFVSVGTQLPFDRLVKSIDQWAISNNRSDVIAQVNKTLYKPKNIRTYSSLSRAEFSTYQRQAGLLVSHAGMGAILGALQLGKPLIMMPRSHKLGEHRNDHQAATAEHFRGTAGIYIANTEKELWHLLDSYDTLTVGSRISPFASNELISALRDFLDEV
jgi:UDP-N-acetylglucosamine transferase subunit ALG13